MAKKNKTSRIQSQDIPSVDIALFKDNAGLLTTQQVTQSVETLTGQKSQNEPKSYGRPKKEKAAGREPFTTSLHSDLIISLKDKANKRRCSVADLLEDILKDSLSKY